MLKPVPPTFDCRYQYVLELPSSATNGRNGIGGSESYTYHPVSPAHRDVGPGEGKSVRFSSDPSVHVIDTYDHGFVEDPLNVPIRQAESVDYATGTTNDYLSAYDSVSSAAGGPGGGVTGPYRRAGIESSRTNVGGKRASGYSRQARVSKGNNLWSQVDREQLRDYYTRQKLREWRQEAKQEAIRMQMTQERLRKLAEERRLAKNKREEEDKEEEESEPHGYFCVSVGLLGFARDDGFVGLFVRSRGARDQAGVPVAPLPDPPILSSGFQESYRIPYHPKLTHLMKVNVYDSMDNWVATANISIDKFVRDKRPVTNYRLYSVSGKPLDNAFVRIRRDKIHIKWGQGDDGEPRDDAGAKSAMMIVSVGCKNLARGGRKHSYLVTLSQKDASFLGEEKDAKFKTVSQTELVTITPNPHFAKEFHFEYGEADDDKHIELVIWRCSKDAPIHKLNDKEQVGKVKTSLKTLAKQAKRGRGALFPLHNGKRKEPDCFMVIHPRFSGGSYGPTAGMIGGARPGPYTISIECKNIPKGDATVTVKARDHRPGSPEDLVGQTEVLTNTSNPKFKNTVAVDLESEFDAELKFQVYHQEEDTVEEKGFQGLSIVSLRQLAVMGQISYLLTDKSGEPVSPAATLMLKCEYAGEEDAANRVFLELTIGCKNLIQMDEHSKSDPIVSVSRKDPQTNIFGYIGQTEKLDNTHDCVFKTKLRLAVLPEHELKFSVYDADSQKVVEEDRMGSVVAQVKDLLEENGQGKKTTLAISHDRKGARDLELRQKGSAVIISTKLLTLEQYRQAQGREGRRALELQVSCRHITKAQGSWDRPDGTVVALSQVDLRTGRDLPLERTECVPSKHGPMFEQSFKVLYDPADGQVLKFYIFNLDEGTANSMDWKVLKRNLKSKMTGTVTVNLNEFIESGQYRRDYKVIAVGPGGEISRDKRQFNKATLTLFQIPQFTSQFQIEEEPNEVELSVACKGLPAGLNQAQLAVFMREPNAHEFDYVGVTETIPSNATHATFKKRFMLETTAGHTQLSFQLVDSSKRTGEAVALVDVPIASLLRNSREPMTFELAEASGKPGIGSLILTAFPVKQTVTLQITVSCSNLIQMDEMGLSDPKVILLSKAPKAASFVQRDQTETIQDNHDPIFKKKLVVEVHPHEELMFSVYDVDQPQVYEVDRMGSVTVRADRLMDAASRDEAWSGFIEHESDVVRQKRLKLNGSSLTLAARVLSEEEAQALRLAKGELRKVKFGLSCKFLPARDDETNPMCAVAIEDPESQTYQDVGSTDRQRNTQHPRFSKFMEVEYWSGLDQNLRLRVHDVDGRLDEVEELQDDTILGVAYLNLREFVGSSAKVMDIKLKDDKGKQIQNAVISVRKLDDSDAELEHAVTIVDVSLGFEGVPKICAKNVVVACYIFDPNTKSFRLFGATEPKLNNRRGTAFNTQFKLKYSPAKDRELEFRLFDKTVFDQFVEVKDEDSEVDSDTESEESDEAETERATEESKEKELPEDKSFDKMFGYVGLPLSSLLHQPKGQEKGIFKIVDYEGSHIDDRCYLTINAVARETDAYDSDIEEDRVQLSLGISCSSLAKLAGLSKNDVTKLNKRATDRLRRVSLPNNNVPNAPSVELYVKNMRSGEFIKHSQTETLWDSINPRFLERFTLQSYQESQLKLSVFDLAPNKVDRICLGEALVMTRDLVANAFTTFSANLTNDDKRINKLLKVENSKVNVFARLHQPLDGKDSKKKGRKKKLKSIQLTLGCRSLPKDSQDQDVHSVVAVFFKDVTQPSWTLWDQTDCVRGSADPRYAQRILFDHHRQKQTELKFEVCKLEDRESLSQNYDQIKEKRLFGSVVLGLNGFLDAEEDQTDLPLLNEKGERVGDSVLCLRRGLITESNPEDAPMLQVGIKCLQLSELRKATYVGLYTKSDDKEKGAEEYKYLSSRTETISTLNDHIFATPLEVKRPGKGEDMEVIFRVFRGEAKRERRLSMDSIDDKKIRKESDQEHKEDEQNKPEEAAFTQQASLMYSELARAAGRGLRVPLSRSGEKKSKDAALQLMPKAILPISSKSGVRIRLTISCKDLLDMDTHSASDPIVVLFAPDETTGKLTLHSKTERLKDTTNPVFERQLELDTYREDELKLSVYDVDYNSADEEDRMGSVTILVDTLLSSIDNTLEVPLSHDTNINRNSLLKRENSRMIIKVELLSEAERTKNRKREYIDFAVSCRYLPDSKRKQSLVVVSRKQEHTGRYKKLDQTERLTGDGELIFTKHFNTLYRSSENNDKFIKLEVFQGTTDNTKSIDSVLVGQALINLTEFAMASEQTLHYRLVDLYNKQLGGTAIISLLRTSVVEDKGNRQQLTVSLSCQNLPRGDCVVMLYARDPVTRELFKSDSTEKHKDTSDPVFRHTFTFDHYQYRDEEFEFRVYRVRSHREITSKDLIGSTTVNLSRLGECAHMKKDILRRLFDRHGRRLQNSLIKFSVSKEIPNDGKHPVCLQLGVSCKKLIKIDKDSDSDPIVSLYVPEPFTGALQYHSQTEHIENEHNPAFKKNFVVNTFMEDELKFNVYDVDNAQVFEERRMGSAMVSVSDLVAKIGRNLTADLIHESDKERDDRLRRKGSTISFEVTRLEKQKQKPPTKGTSSKLSFAVACRYLPMYRGRNMTDPIAMVFLSNAYTEGFEYVGRTDVVQDTSNPEFERVFTVDVYEKAEGQLLKVALYDMEEEFGEYSEPRAHNLIGHSIIDIKDFYSQGGLGSYKVLDAEEQQVGNALVQVRRAYDGQQQAPVVGKVVVSVRCEGLKFLADEDFHAMCAMYYRDKWNCGVMEWFDQTEAITGDRNPVFEAVFCIPYREHVDREIEFRVFDQSEYCRKYGELSPPVDMLGAISLPLSLLVDYKKSLKSKDDELCRPLYDSVGVAQGSIFFDARLTRDSWDKTPVTLKLDLSCNDLIKMDDDSDSDPMVVLFVRDEQTAEFRFHSRTEKIDNNHNPHFQCQLEVETFLEDDIRLSVYDCDEATGTYSESDRMGSTHLEVADLVGAAKLGKKISRRLKNRSNRELDRQLKKRDSTIHVRARAKEGHKSIGQQSFGCSANALPYGKFGSDQGLVVAFFIEEHQSGRLIFLGNTESVWDELNPYYEKEIKFDRKPSELAKCNLKAYVYAIAPNAVFTPNIHDEEEDDDDATLTPRSRRGEKKKSLAATKQKQQELLGVAHIDIEQFLTTSFARVQYPIEVLASTASSDSSIKPSLTLRHIRHVDPSSREKYFKIDVRARDISRRDFFTPATTFVAAFVRDSRRSQFELVSQSEVVPQADDPNYSQPLYIPMGTAGDDHEIQIRVYNSNTPFPMVESDRADDKENKKVQAGALQDNVERALVGVASMTAVDILREERLSVPLSDLQGSPLVARNPPFVVVGAKIVTGKGGSERADHPRSPDRSKRDEHFIDNKSKYSLSRRVSRDADGLDLNRRDSRDGRASDEPLAIPRSSSGSRLRRESRDSKEESKTESREASREGKEREREERKPDEEDLVQVEITVRAKHLVPYYSGEKETMSSMVVAYMEHPVTGHLTYHSETDLVGDEVNPVYETKLSCSGRRKDFVHLRVYDGAGRATGIIEEDLGSASKSIGNYGHLLGEVECSINELLEGRKQEYSLRNKCSLHRDQLLKDKDAYLSVTARIPDSNVAFPVTGLTSSELDAFQMMFPPRAAEELPASKQSELELDFTCKGLFREGTGTEAFVVVRKRNNRSGTFQYMGHTEDQKGGHNTDFTARVSFACLPTDEIRCDVYKAGSSPWKVECLRDCKLDGLLGSVQLPAADLIPPLADQPMMKMWPLEHSLDPVEDEVLASKRARLAISSRVDVQPVDWERAKNVRPIRSILLQVIAFCRDLVSLYKDGRQNLVTVSLKKKGEDAYTMLTQTELVDHRGQLTFINKLVIRCEEQDSLQFTVMEGQGQSQQPVGFAKVKVAQLLRRPTVAKEYPLYSEEDDIDARLNEGKSRMAFATSVLDIEYRQAYKIQNRLASVDASQDPFRLELCVSGRKWFALGRGGMNATVCVEKFDSESNTFKLLDHTEYIKGSGRNPTFTRSMLVSGHRLDQLLFTVYDTPHPRELLEQDVMGTACLEIKDLLAGNFQPSGWSAPAMVSLRAPNDALLNKKLRDKQSALVVKARVLAGAVKPGPASVDMGDGVELAGFRGRPTVLLELSVACRNLINIDVTNRPKMCVLHAQNADTLEWELVGRSESLSSSSPTYQTKFKCHTHPLRKLRFSMYEAERSSGLSETNRVGSVIVKVSTLVEYAAHLSLPLRNGRNSRRDLRLTDNNTKVTVRTTVLESSDPGIKARRAGGTGVLAAVTGARPARVDASSGEDDDEIDTSSGEDNDESELDSLSDSGIYVNDTDGNGPVPRRFRPPKMEDSPSIDKRRRKGKKRRAAARDRVMAAKDRFAVQTQQVDIPGEKMVIRTAEDELSLLRKQGVRSDQPVTFRLEFEAKQLLSLDWFSKSSPILLAYSRTPDGHGLRCLGKTEIIPYELSLSTSLPFCPLLMCASLTIFVSSFYIR